MLNEQKKEQPKKEWASEGKFLEFLTAGKLDMDQFTWKWFIDLPSDRVSYLCKIFYYGFMDPKSSANKDYLVTLNKINQSYVEWIVRVESKHHFNYYTFNKLALEEIIMHFISTLQNYYFNGELRCNHKLTMQIHYLKTGFFNPESVNISNYKSVLKYQLKQSGYLTNKYELTEKAKIYLCIYDKLENLLSKLKQRMSKSKRFPILLSQDDESSAKLIPVIHFPLHE
jgi:hypothetical protein